MYSKLNINDELISTAKRNIILNREKIFSPFFLAVEDFIKDNNLIIGGDCANLMILDTHGDEINILYHIYSEEPKEDAIELSTKLFNLDPNGIARYINVHTKIPNNIYQITINNYICCILYKVPIHKGIQIEKLIECQSLNGIKNKNIKLLCMGNYIQLINLYRDINDPNNSSNWEANLINERIIRKKYLNSIQCEVREKHNHINIDMGFLYKEFICNSDMVVIGDASLYILKHKEATYKSLRKFRLQLISTSDLESKGKKLSILGKKHNIDIQWVISYPKYIEDYNLKRLTAMVIIEGKKKTILDIFNYGEYSLIGYNSIQFNPEKHKSHNTIKYGSIFITMRFMLLEEWIFKFLAELKSINEHMLDLMINNIQCNYILLSEILEGLWEEERLVEYIYNLEYIGIHRDTKIELKRKASKMVNQFSTYYPLKPKENILLSTK